jgi:hypothetical protein
VDLSIGMTEKSAIIGGSLYIVGTILKESDFIKDKYIPLVLLALGILISLFSVSFDIDGAIQGVFATGSAVLVDQVKKQTNKEE